MTSPLLSPTIVSRTTQPQITDEITLNNQFLLAEDKALRNLILGSVVVTDGNNKQRPLGCWYSMADPELQKQTYPYAIIDLLDVIENRPQIQSGYGPICTSGPESYLLNGLDIPDDTYTPGILYGLTPWLLTYQVTTYARMPRHDRSIIAGLTDVLHPRFAQINVNNNMRRLIVLGFSKRDTTTADKRLFRNAWTIQIPSEKFYDPVTLTKRAESVSINSGTLTAPAGFVDPLYPGRS